MHVVGVGRGMAASTDKEHVDTAHRELLVVFSLTNRREARSPVLHFVFSNDAYKAFGGHLGF